MRKPRGLVAQLIRLLLGTGLCCVLLFFALQSAVRAGLLYYNDHSDVQQRSVERQVERFQKYVTARSIKAGDVPGIDDWVNRQGFLMMNIYRGRRLLYSNFSPDSVGKEQGARDSDDAWEQAWTVQFADGTAQVQLYCNLVLNWWMVAGKLIILFCVAVFLLVFWRGCRRIVNYIILLSEEIQAMEGGDLDHPITIRGDDELSTLASCLDSMRVTLCQQQQQEAEASAKVRNLITEMSHDLRTPLTTLLLYTEIVRGGRYQGGKQLHDYLNKIDAKARQIKQLSDNLFEYALVTRDTVVELDPPAYFSQIFEEPLAEMVDTLQQRGFACALDLGEEDLLLRVKGQYIRRILDNVSSNIIKYADPAQDIEVHFVREGSRVGLAFANGVVENLHPEDSTRVGLTSIETMMEKMNAETRIEQGSGRFCITLLFPRA